MNQYMTDVRAGLQYELQGDYYYPCLTVPAEEEKSIGIWGQRHLRYLRQCRRR